MLLDIIHKGLFSFDVFPVGRMLGDQGGALLVGEFEGHPCAGAATREQWQNRYEPTKGSGCTRTRSPITSIRASSSLQMSEAFTGSSSLWILKNRHLDTVNSLDYTRTHLLA